MLNDTKISLRYEKQEIKALITPTPIKYNQNLDVYILLVIFKYAHIIHFYKTGYCVLT